MDDGEGIGTIRFRVALVVATTFKVFAALTLIGGVLVLIGINDSSADDRSTYIATAVAGTVISAAVLAFFGYVIEILVAIFEELWNVRINGETD